jgi:large subunit ribosomal protein L24e
MAKCSFCGIEVERGTGFIYVEKIGKVHNYCSSKCFKNVEKLGRKPKHSRWTQEAQKNKGKISAASEQEELQRDAAATAGMGKQKLALSGAAAKKLKGGA